MRLNRAAIEVGDVTSSTLRPGDSLWVHLDWEVLSPMEEDWSIFVHAVDPVLGRPVAQRDMYPGQGLQLTSRLEPGTRLTNSYHIQLPETVVSPAQLELITGLYNIQTGERLTTGDNRDFVSLGTMALQAAEGEHPNPTSISFEGELELDGYAIEPRSVAAGETIKLSLYWRPLRPLQEDYTFFAQVVDEDTTRWASIDYVPSDSTSTWSPNIVQVVPLSLALAPDTPDNVYPLIVGVYTRDNDGGFNRLQLLTLDGRLTDDFLEVTQVRVE